MNRLVDKTCLVTGAAQGIGHSITEAFVAEGARVIALDLGWQHKEADSDSIVRLTVDVTDATAIDALAASYPEASVLVNCVGWVANGSLLECTLDDFDRCMNINVRSMVLTMRAFLPLMRRRRQGSIINIASVVSTVMAAPGRFAYTTSKAAVIGLTQSAALDYAADGVRCNCISPGTIDTPSLHSRFSLAADPDAMRCAFVDRQPMKRLGSAAEIAAVAVLLASDDAAFMTGSNIVVDGGMSL